MSRSMMLVAALAASISTCAFAQQGRPQPAQQAQERAAEQGRKAVEQAADKAQDAEKKAEHAALATGGQMYALAYCPVSGNPLGDDAVVKVYDGREVRFCCDKCPERFETDKASYWGRMDAQVIAQQRWDYPLETCPVSGHALGEGGEPVEIVVGTRYAKLCCDGCIEDFRANADEHFKTIDAAIIEKQRDAYPLATCVVSGEKLGSMGDPVDVVVGTTLVRLCCKSCVKELAKAPWKALEQIAAAK